MTVLSLSSYVGLIHLVHNHFPKPPWHLLIPDISTHFQVTERVVLLLYSSLHSSSPHRIHCFDMSPVPSLSPRDIIDATLAKYTALTDKDPVNDPLVAKIKSCYTHDSDICPILQQHARTFRDHSKLTTCLKVIVDHLQDLSTTPALGGVAGRQAVCL